MHKKIIIILSLTSLLFTLSSVFYSPQAAGARHKRHHTNHRCQHVAHHKPRHSSIHATKHTSPQKQAVEADKAINVNPRVWGLALKAYNNALKQGYIRQKILTVIDYSLPSSVKRMWVIDLTSQKVLYHTLVAHGKHTGGLFAKHFSDRPGSLASSIGTFITENTYMGSKGYSLRLKGLEPGFNDKAKSRAIVMHGAWYATQDFARHHGRLGLSWGCPAVAPTLAKPIINQIKNGSLVFAYFPDSQWLQKSRFLETDVG